MSSRRRALSAGLAMLLALAVARSVEAWSCVNPPLNQIQNCGFDPPGGVLAPWFKEGLWVTTWTDQGNPGPPGNSPVGYYLAGASGAAQIFRLSQCRSVAPNTTYDWGAWLYDPANGNCGLLLDVYGGGGCTGATVQNDIKLFTPGAWFRASGSLTTAASAVSAKLAISCTSSAAATIGLDEAFLTPRRCRAIFRDDFESPDQDTCEWGAGCAGAGLQVIEAISLKPDRMLLCFNHPLDATTVGAAGTNVTFDNGLTETGAVASGRELQVTTSAQTAGATYTATVGAPLEDLFGVGVSGADGSAPFTGFDGP